MRHLGTHGTLLPSMATPASVKSFPYCDRRGPSKREESVQGSTAAGNDDFMGCPITGENKVLFEEVSPFPLLSHKLRLLIKMLRCAPTVEKVANSATMALSLFYMYRNFSQIFRTAKTLASESHRSPPVLMQHVKEMVSP
jgi:hypothetical protein